MELVINLWNGEYPAFDFIEKWKPLKFDTCGNRDVLDFFNSIDFVHTGFWEECFVKKMKEWKKYHAATVLWCTNVYVWKSVVVDKVAVTQNNVILKCNQHTWHPDPKVKMSWFNSFWPGDNIWLHRSGSTLAQVMVCCLTAPNHYLNQCWLIITGVLCHSHEHHL